MKASELLQMKVGDPFKLYIYLDRHTSANYCIGTITAIMAPKAIAVLMHSGYYKNETIFLRGFDLSQMELLNIAAK